MQVTPAKAAQVAARELRRLSAAIHLSELAAATALCVSGCQSLTSSAELLLYVTQQLDLIVVN